MTADGLYDARTNRERHDYPKHPAGSRRWIIALGFGGMPLPPDHVDTVGFDTLTECRKFWETGANSAGPSPGRRGRVQSAPLTERHTQ